MALWLVRAGRHGEREELALEKNLIAIGWSDIPDLNIIDDREDLKNIYSEKYPNSSKGKAANHVGQIWRFAKEIKIGDLVAMPLKIQSGIAIGEVKWNYEYNTEYGEYYYHLRPVEWKGILPKSDFDQDILYSLGAIMTVGKARAEDAEQRVRKILSGEVPSDIEGTEEEVQFNIEQIARDEINKYINQKFKGHELARLVDAILQAQGYITTVSPPGPDGGVDILAGSGSLGFGGPRICVQVKSGKTRVDVNIYRQLQGTLKKVGAEQGLLVSLGGFKSSVGREARGDFFSVRIWDAEDLITEIFRYYPKFSDELKADLPLKRIWTIVTEEE